ncbi:MAG: RNHCP domain-containing protein [Anaerolineaceae bacterium]|nr:RNHCP domain-containing protein [Anaerolineaceae bacterium]
MSSFWEEAVEGLLPARARSRVKRSRAGMLPAWRTQAEDGFRCRHCGVFVSSAVWLAGVLNRNHCPYCLWSRHLDLYQPGDRLSACQAPMRPAGLSHKQTQKKYASARLGELLLVHVCTGCSGVSINRLAADDDVETVLQVFEQSLQMDAALQSRLATALIRPLTAEHRGQVQAQLLGTFEG